MSFGMSGAGEIAWATISDLAIRLARSGGEEGTPVLLLSPWPESILGFRGVIPKLQNAGPVIAVDLPGFGRSEGAEEFLSPLGMSGFLRTLIRSLGLKRVHAVGPDIGTPALLFAARRWPDLFESLVLGSGGVSLPLAGDGLRELIESPAGAFGEREGGEIALQFVRGAAAQAIPEEVLEDYRASSAGARFEQAAQFVRSYRKDLPRLEPLLSTVEVPALILSSDGDAMVPAANGEFLAARMRRSRHVVLRGGHLLWEDCAEEYGELVAEWIGGGYRTLAPGGVRGA